MGGAFTVSCGVLKAGDWFYFYPTDSTVQTYQFTSAK